MSRQTEILSGRNICSLRDCLWLPASALVFFVLAVAYGAGRWALAVYSLSFWHYGVYALAYFWRAIPLARFKSDAMILKSASLAVLAAVYVPGLSSPASVLVVLCGFALNMAAARVIGSDRTYYGYELTGMPAQWASAFPFSVLPHPMLTGNVIAYCGLLLDPSFREHWALLALLHAGLNLGILAMEIYGSEGRKPGTIWPLGALLAGSILLLTAFRDIWPFALIAVAGGAAFGAFLFLRYTRFRDNQV